MDENILNNFMRMENKNETKEVLKELFDLNKWFMITDLSQKEQQIYLRIFMISKLKNIPSWEDALMYYSLFKISNKRMSRHEMIRAISGYEQRMGFMARIRNRFSGNNNYNNNNYGGY